MGIWPSSPRGTGWQTAGSFVTSVKHGPSPSREVLSTRFTKPFPRSQSLAQTTAGFTLYRSMFRPRSGGKGTSPRSHRQEWRLAVDARPNGWRVRRQPWFTHSTGFTNPPSAPGSKASLGVNVEGSRSPPLVISRESSDSQRHQRETSGEASGTGRTDAASRLLLGWSLSPATVSKTRRHGVARGGAGA